MDSKVETRKHIQQVRDLIDVVINKLKWRAYFHDRSKLESPEVEIFDQFNENLPKLTYGSEEYKQNLEMVKPALEHHYKHNPHHPEYYENGIREMNLLDLIEMLCDWKAATLRHEDGDIRKSVEINQKRFGYSDELKQIFLNTLDNWENPMIY